MRLMLSRWMVLILELYLATLSAIWFAATAARTPVPVAAHVVRSARPGDQCNFRRDVVLLADPALENAYLQCQREPGNGSAGIWRKVVCNAEEVFSYSRQRCLVPSAEGGKLVTTEQTPQNDNISPSPGSKRGTTDGHSATKGIVKTNRKLITIAPLSRKQHESRIEAPVTSKIRGRTRRPSTRPTEVATDMTTPTTDAPDRLAAATSTTSSTTSSTTTTLPTTTTKTGVLGYQCGFGSKCTDANSVCVSDICNCAEGFALRIRGHQYYCAAKVKPTTTSTTPPATTTSTSSTTVSTTAAPTTQLVLLAPIGERCSADGGVPICLTVGAECLQGMCQCPSGHIVKDNACVLQTLLRPGDPCDEEVGGTCGGGSACFGGRCTCKEGDTVQDGLCVIDRRLRPGEPCNAYLGPEVQQCTSDSYCMTESGLCTCQEGFVIINWTCTTQLVSKGQYCQSPPQTCVDGLECIDNICQYAHFTKEPSADTGYICPVGWISLEIDQKRFCAPSMLKLGEACLSPFQTCTGGSACQQGQCACPQDFVAVQDFCVPLPPAPSQRRALGTTCTDSIQCVWAGGVCQDGHCVCPPGTNSVMGSCQLPESPYSVLAGGYCTASNHCVPGLACVYGVCVCTPAYDCEKTAAQPSPPGASCAFSRLCSGSSTCKNGWCVCPEARMIVENGQCVQQSSMQQKSVNATMALSPHAHRLAPYGTVHQIQRTVPEQGGQFQPAPLLPGLLPNGISGTKALEKTAA